MIEVRAASTFIDDSLLEPVVAINLVVSVKDVRELTKEGLIDSIGRVIVDKLEDFTSR